MKRFILFIYIFFIITIMHGQKKELKELDLSLSLKNAAQLIEKNQFQSYQNYGRYIHWIAVLVKPVKIKDSQSGFLLMDAEWLETEQIISYRFVLTAKDPLILKKIKNIDYNEKIIIIGKMKNVINFQDEKMWEIDAFFIKKI